MLPPITRSAAASDVRALFERRYTAKSYDPARSVGEDDLEAILTSARLSASSMGLEPWHFLVLSRGDLMDALTAHCWGYHPHASHLVVLLGRNCEHFRSGSAYIEHIHCDVQGRERAKLEERYEAIERFLADDLGLASEDAITGWVDRQVYIALGSMLVSSAMLGVDSTAIEGLKVDEVSRALVEAGAFDPKEYHVVCALALGYTDREAHRDKTRRPESEVITRLR